MMHNQILDQRYVDKHRLFTLLKEQFGVGNFEVEDLGEALALVIPRALTEVYPRQRLDIFLRA